MGARISRRSAERFAGNALRGVRLSVPDTQGETGYSWDVLISVGQRRHSLPRRWLRGECETTSRSEHAVLCYRTCRSGALWSLRSRIRMTEHHAIMVPRVGRARTQRFSRRFERRAGPERFRAGKEAFGRPMRHIGSHGLRPPPSQNRASLPWRWKPPRCTRWPDIGGSVPRASWSSPMSWPAKGGIQGS